MVSVIGARRSFNDAAFYSKTHPFPDCWGYYQPGKDCPKEKPDKNSLPKICSLCPMSKGYKSRKSNSNTGSGGYGEV